MDEIDDMKLELSKKVGEPVGLSYYLNVGIINCLWTIVSGRRLHAQQQVILLLFALAMQLLESKAVDIEQEEVAAVVS